MPRTKQVARPFVQKAKPANWNIKVNENQIIQCNKEVIISLSPTIAKFIEDNPSSASYDIKSTIQPLSDNAWIKISDYLRGDNIFVSIVDVPFYLDISQKLNLKDFIQFLEEVYSDVKSSCDYSNKYYDQENPFLIKLESLEQSIFQLNINNFQETITFILEFLNDENFHNKSRFFSNLIYQFCITRNSTNDYNLGIDLLYQIFQQKKQIKDEIIKFLIPTITSNIQLQYFTRTLYEKKILTNDDMKSLINLFTLEEKYKDNFATLPSNLVYFFDFIITELSSNQLKFSNRHIWNSIGTLYEPYSKIKCEINPNDKEGVFGLNCFSVNVEDTKLDDYMLSELMKNDWELHKKFCKEGNNISKIACLIRNDDLNNFLSFISNESNFNINKKIPFSIYEKTSMLNDCTLIQYAAYYSSIKIFKYLIVQKAEVKENIFNFAIAGGDLEIIHICDEIKFNTDILPKRLFGFILSNDVRPRLYDISIEYHRHDILRWIVETKKIVPKSINIISSDNPLLMMENNSNLIHLCLTNCNFVSLHYLLTQEFYFSSLLSESINENLLELAKFSLNLKFLPNDDSKLNGNALYNACKLGDIEFLKLFIEDKNILSYQKEKMYSSSFVQACSMNNFDVVKLILMNLPDIDINEKYLNESSLYIACKKGYIEIVQLLIQYRLNDLDFNALYHNDKISLAFFNYTSLNIACKNGHLEIVKLLLSTGKVNINFDIKKGKNPLYYALVSGNIELVKLISSKVKNKKDDDPKIINFYFIPACRSGNIELIQLFLNQYGNLIDINTNECPSEIIFILFFK